MIPPGLRESRVLRIGCARRPAAALDTLRTGGFVPLSGNEGGLGRETGWERTCLSGARDPPTALLPGLQLLPTLGQDPLPVPLGSGRWRPWPALGHQRNRAGDDLLTGSTGTPSNDWNQDRFPACGPTNQPRIRVTAHAGRRWSALFAACVTRRG